MGITLTKGRIRETLRSEKLVCFEWIVVDYFSDLKDEPCIYRSPPTSFLGSSWNLKLSPNGGPELDNPSNSKCLLLEMENQCCGCQNLVRFTLGIKRADGVYKDILYFHQPCSSQSPENQVKAIIFKSCLQYFTFVPLGTLIITCTMEKGNLTDTEGKRESLDVDEENCQRCEDLQDEGWDALGRNVKVMSKIPNDAWKAMELYSDGIKRDFPEMKEMCLRYLMSTLSTDSVAEVLFFSKENGEEELMMDAREFFKKNFTETVKTTSFHQLFVAWLASQKDFMHKVTESNDLRRKMELYSSGAEQSFPGPRQFFFDFIQILLYSFDDVIASDVKKCVKVELWKQRAKFSSRNAKQRNKMKASQHLVEGPSEIISKMERKLRYLAI